MTSPNKQPISGVSANHENVVMTIWPSVCAGAIGRILGQLMDLSSVKIPFTDIPITNALVSLATAPLFAAGYFAEKILGKKYVITNRSVQIWSSLRPRKEREVALGDFADIDIVQRPGQSFYNAADIALLGSNGLPILVLAGVPRPVVFRQTILKAREARTKVAEALATIAERLRDARERWGG